MKTIYDHYIANPPVTEDGQRKRGNTSQHAFWIGFDGKQAMGEPTSNARLAWQAGRDTAKDERLAEMNRQRVQKHRENKRRKGLVKVEVWVKPEHKQAVIDFIKQLD